MQYAVPAQKLVRLVPQAHNPLGEGEEPGSGIRQLDPVPVALEQLHAVGPFKLLDLRGHGRLADPERACCGCKSAVGGDRMKGP